MIVQRKQSRFVFDKKEKGEKKKRKKRKKRKKKKENRVHEELS